MTRIQLTYREQIILMSVAGGARYGWEIQSIVAEHGQGRYKLPLGSLYPALHALEEKGAVVSEWEEDRAIGDRGGARRRLYHCTEAGRAAIQEILDFQWRLLKCNEQLSEVS